MPPKVLRTESNILELLEEKKKYIGIIAGKLLN
jgi:hypothetical protein